MKDFDLRKYLAENKLLKEDLYDELDKFEGLEGEFSYQPSSQGILAINNFIEFIQDRNLGRDLDKAFDMYTDDEENEFPPSSDTLVDIENFIDFVNTPEDSVEEGILSTIGMIGAGIFGFQFIKGMLRNILVRIGKNVKLKEEKLKEMVNTLTKKALLKGSKDDNMVIINWRNETNEKIESGEIKTLEQILSTLPETQD